MIFCYIGARHWQSDHRTCPLKMTKPSSNPKLIQAVLRKPGIEAGWWENKVLVWTKADSGIWTAAVQEHDEKPLGCCNEITNAIHYCPDTRKFTSRFDRPYYNPHPLSIDEYGCEVEVRGGEIGFTFTCSSMKVECELHNEELFATENLARSALARHSLELPFTEGAMSIWDALAREELTERGVLGERAINPFDVKFSNAWLPEADPEKLNTLFETPFQITDCGQWKKVNTALYELTITTDQKTCMSMLYDRAYQTLQLGYRRIAWVPPQIQVTGPEKYSRIVDAGVIVRNWYFQLHVGELNIGRLHVLPDEIQEDFAIRELGQHPENCLKHVSNRVAGIWRTQIYDILLKEDVLAPAPEPAPEPTPPVAVSEPESAPAPESQYVVIPSEGIPSEFPTAESRPQGFCVKLTQAQADCMRGYGYTEQKKCPDGALRIQFDSLLDYSVFLEAFLESYTLESATPLTSTEQSIDLRPYGLSSDLLPQLPAGITAWTIPRRDFDRLKAIHLVGGEVFSPTMYHVKPTHVNHKKCTVPPYPAEGKIVLVPEGGGVDNPIPAVSCYVPQMDPTLIFVTLGYPKSE